MKVLVVYDSTYGNTEKVAKAVGAAMSGEVRVVRASEVGQGGLDPGDLLVVGSPTQGGRATQAVQTFIAQLPENALNGVRVAAFDTRYAGRFVKVFGYAADRIASSLHQKGGQAAGAPTGFVVKGKDGPLKEGELERAAQWAKEIAK